MLCVWKEEERNKVFPLPDSFEFVGLSVQRMASANTLRQQIYQMNAFDRNLLFIKIGLQVHQAGIIGRNHTQHLWLLQIALCYRPFRKKSLRIWQRMFPEATACL